MILDAEFYKSFAFRRFDFNKYRTTDNTVGNGCSRHFFAKMVKGSAKLCGERDTVYLKEGDYFYIPRGEKYRSFWYPNEQGEISFYSFGFFYLPKEQTTSYALQKFCCNTKATEFFSAIEKDLTVSPRTIGLLYEFFDVVRNELIVQKRSLSNATVDKAVSYMRQNVDCAVKQVAEHCMVSESGLYVKFRTVLGKTPTAIRHEILAEKAKELLITTDMTVEEICSLLKVSSSSYFRKMLRAQLQKTPSEIRRKSRIL